MSALQRYERIHLQAPSYRACLLCEHGGCSAAHTPCKHPAACTAPYPIAVGHMRAPGGPCGPEAELMHFPGLSR